MPYAVITIGAQDYEAYETVAQISTYAAAAIGDAPDAWRAADADTQGRAGVSATRTLDRQSWQGTMTDPNQGHAFPRTGLTYADGTAVDPTAIPQQLLDADSELAMALTAGATFETDASTENATRRLKAGSVEIEYFRIPGTGTRFPLAVMELIGLWLGGLSTVDGSEASGVCDKTSFGRPNYDLSRGF